MKVRALALSLLGIFVALSGSSALFAESTINTKSDVEILRMKREQFKKQSKNYTGCARNLTLTQCIAAVDKLLVLSTTNLFPTAKFNYVYVADHFADVKISGYVTVDFNASTDEIREHLAMQTDEFQVLQEKREIFASKSQNKAACGNVSFSECGQCLDKLIALSTDTALFPTNSYVLIIVHDRYADVFNASIVAVDYRGTEAELRAHLVRQ